MSRYGPPPRDRSPPRYNDRRPSTYGLGSSYRGTGDPQTPIDRDPPRGPRADNFRGAYPYTPAGRGRGSTAFPPRPTDNWRDRERDRDRDTRPTQSYRSREDDRPEWQRRDRDIAPLDRPAPPRGNYPPRDRSASPPRGRRDSRESLPPLASRQSDNAASFRGGLSRGRGRGDWDRPRDRASFIGDRDRDRDLFSNRSPSRDSSWRDRDFERTRPAGPDNDRGDRYVGRDRSRERRDHDVWPRDHSPARMSTGAGARVPSPANSAGPHGPSDRASKMDYELTRRTSIAATPGSATREVRRDGEQGDYFQRGELRRETSYTSIHQPPAPAPSATAGLDYGPPPSVPATTPLERPAPSRAPTTKSISPAATSAPFQPPSGPKADRAASSSMPKPSAPYEAPKTDPHQVRAVSNPISTPASKAVTELFPKKMDQKADIKPAPSSSFDKSMPPNVPSGPRSASFGSSYRSRPPLSEMSPQFTPPKLPAADNRSSQIPTGPRLDRDRDPRDMRDVREGPRPTGPSNIAGRSWVSPEYSRAKPSIMSPINRDHPTFPPTGPRSQSILPPRGDKGRPQPPSIMNSAITAAASGRPGQPSILRSPGNVPSNADSATDDVDMSLPVSSDEEGEDDEFDEDDFAASEAKFEKERKALEARKPPPFLHDTTIRNLLIRIQFLNMIASNVMPEAIGQSDTKGSDTKDGKADHGLPSPEGPSEDDATPEIKEPIPRGRPLREPYVNPIPTPPIEELPYLKPKESEPIMFEESEDEVQLESITMLVRQEFERNAFDRQQELDALHDDYKMHYLRWKAEVTNLDQANRKTHTSPAPASPAPSAAASVTPSISHERTRGGRNTTEADLQAAIALSEQSMKEEEERREREAQESCEPNYEHEAVIPLMLPIDEAEMDEFEDTSGLISHIYALDRLRYIPPEDDFTPDEQEAFIHAFCLTPKKWGKIAESLPGRDFKQCISHYYLTKGQAKYKDIWRRAQPKRKGRKGASKQPRATALMSELYREGEDGAVAVTDTGRPKRAAAPTFGDNGPENDAAVPTPPAKRVAGAKETSGEAAPPKPRTRKPGTTAKPRGKKAQQAADAAQAAQAAQGTGQIPPVAMEGSPPKLPVARDRARTLLRADEAIPKAELAPALPLGRMGEYDMPQYAGPDDRNGHLAAAAAHAQALNQPTSYWSVPEQTKFPQLIAYYGRDFGAIADFMKTKTSTMIKNHYNRQIADGKTELEDVAKQAEAKRAAGEFMGRPPSPAVQTKRRYEATPSTASAQSLGRSLLDQAPEGDHPAMPTKQGYTDDFPANTVQRNFTGDLVAKSRTDSGMPLQPAKHEDTPRSGLLSKPLTGPRMGFFREEATPYGAPRQNLSRDNSPHQHPLRPGDHRFADIGQRVPASSPRQIHLGPPRDTLAMTSNPPAQNPATASALHAERFGLPQHLHARNASAASHNHSVLEQAKDLASLRQLDPMSRPYSILPPQSATPPPVVGALLRQAENRQNTSSAPIAEPPKPAPAKRSNIMSILNDDPPEPNPVKRASSDSQHRPLLMSPQTIPQGGPSFDPSRNPLRLDGSPADIDRKRTPQSFAPHPLREQQSGYGSAPPSNQNETWLDKFDPRPQSGMGDHRSLHQSPRAAQYSVVPPGSSNLRMEPSRPGENAQDHRRTFLGQLSHPGNNPSPPPQQASYRSISGSSQQPHSRVGSLGFSQSQGPQPQAQQQQGPGIQSHSLSTSSTPVSSLHHGRLSIDHDQHQRQTIQQHLMHMQAPSRDPDGAYRQQERDREHQRALEHEAIRNEALRNRENDLQRAREQDAMRGREQEFFRAREQQEALLAREREGLRGPDRDPFGYRRAMQGYGPPPPRENEPHSSLHGHQMQPGQPASQQRPLGFADSLQRSYTPQPHHQAQQQQQQQQPPQYGQPHGTGPPQGQGPYHPHHAQGGPKPLHQGPPPPPQQAGPPQHQQGSHPAYMSHYRNASQDERR